MVLYIQGAPCIAQSSERLVILLRYGEVAEMENLGLSHMPSYLIFILHAGETLFQSVTWCTRALLFYN